MFNFFKKKSKKAPLSDIDIIAENYIECIRYFYRGEKIPFVKSFTDDMYFWLETDIGLIELTKIPHDEAILTERRMEIEALIADNNYNNSEIIEHLNDKLKTNW